MSAEFKISKIRYTWAGGWTPNTAFIQDSVVSYGGQAFVCLIGSTSSSNFYNDLNASPNPIWLQMTYGKQWVGTWNPGGFYTTNTIVTYAGNLYTCVTPHTSAVFLNDFNNGNWSLFLQENSWSSSWLPNTNYTPGQFVNYGGITYKCISGHTSAASTALGLETTQGSWTVWSNGVVYLGPWQTNYRYKLNDLVKLDANIYIATNASGFNSGSTFNTANWALYLPGQSDNLTWTTLTVYQIGDAVVYGGTAYVSRTANNSNNIPSLDSTNWTQFNVGFKVRGAWLNATAYVTGDVINRNGMLYEATTNNTGQDPQSTTASVQYVSAGSSRTTVVVDSTAALSVGMIVRSAGFNLGQYISVINNATTITLDREPNTTLTNNQSITFGGVNATYWKLLIPGGAWLGVWSKLTTYIVGDQIIWTNQTYQCIQSNTNVLPSGDIINAYWVILISHALINAMNTSGDTETYNSATGPQYTRIPIGSTSTALKVNGTTKLPNWQQLSIIPAVYYVDCFSGVDDSLHGTSWDAPFKTINYACNYINTALYFPNATAILKKNKAWMITEMYQWMLYQKANNISPYTSDSLFDPYYTQRDAGYIVDAIVYDLQRGGNSQTVAATLRFFFYGSSTQIVNSLTESVITYIATSLTYLQSLIVTVINQQAPTSSYQTLNGLSGVNYVPQITTGPTPELGAGVLPNVLSLMSIVITAVTNQNTYLVPKSNTGTTAILNIKTGTYTEILPILVPENVSIVGDELRSTTVQPVTSVQFYATATTNSTNVITITDSTGLTDQMPVQFITPYLNNTSTSFEAGITPGQTYYVQGTSITSTSFKVLDAATRTITGTISSGSNIIANVDSITNLKVGQNVTGTGIPTGTVINSLNQTINGIVTVTISNNATASLISQSFIVTGNIVLMTGGTGSMLVYAGDCLKNMWLMTNGTTMRNLSNFGLLGQLSSVDQYGLATPTGGAYTSFNPGTGPNDTSAWIFRRSPYIQNVTNFGTGCVGLLVDGALHNGGTKSMVTNDYTQVLNDGIGVWVANSNAISECVSVFSYFCYIGHYASGGGRIRSTNGNSSYGVFGVVSSGYDLNEIPSAGTVFNQSTQIQASVSDAFGTRAQLIKLNFFNAGSGYFNPATNMISQSNALTTSPWVNDGNVSFIRNNTAPTGITEAWLLTGAQNIAGTSYIQQSIAINPTGHYFAAIPGTSNGTGSGASFNVTATPTGYSISVVNSGVIYTVGQTITISGSTFGGLSPTNDATLTVATVTMTSWTSNGSATTGTYYYYYNPVYGSSNYYQATGTGTFGTTAPVLGQNLTSGNVPLTYVGTYTATSSANIKVGSLLTVTSTGTVPPGTSQAYTLSAYVYPGSSSTVDIQAIFSGSATKVSGISYNVTSNVITPYAGTALGNVTNAGSVPVAYGANKTLTPGWYRVWMAVNDVTGLNTTLTYKLFPQGANAPVANAYSIIYGTQVEISGFGYPPNFYLETTLGMYTAYANYEITGAGSGANLIGDENRSKAVFNTRITTDSNGFTGGSGYATNTANAQTGNAYSIQLSNADAGVYNYVNMRVLVQSGLGAGQYGWIAYYNNRSVTDANGIAARTALVLKESVDTITITSTTYSATAANNLFALSNGTDLSRIYVNQVLQFVPTYFNATITSTSLGTVTAVATVGGTTNTIQVSSAASLFLNMPVIFSTLSGSGFSITPGYVYYIININGNLIQIATSLSGQAIQLTNVTLVSGNSMTATFPNYSGYLTGNNATVNMVPCILIAFTGVALGGVTLGQQYYVTDIVDANNFVVSGTSVVLTSTVSTGGSTNTITTSTTTGLVPLNAIVFTGNIFDAAITTNTTYYISNIIDGSNFQITSSIIRTTATHTFYSTNLIQISTSVLTWQVGQPVIFSGISAGQNFGGIQRETVYYILNPNPTTNQIQISLDGINPVNLVDAIGQINARTAPAPNPLGGGSGSMLMSSTGPRVTVTNSIGVISTMTATYSLSLIGGVNSYTRYYITAINTGATPTISVGTSLAGTPITLITATGTMQMGASGWDNFNPGTPVEPVLDSQSIYFIEPRVTFSLPTWTQVSGTVTTPLSGATWKTIGAGNNMFIALPNTGAVGATSTDGLTWTSMTLPSTIATWSSIAFGNFYWCALGINNSGTSVAIYSNSSGKSWYTSSMPSNYNWSSIAYGNGVFVAIASNATQTTSISVTVTSSKWTAVRYGNGLTVAISQTGATQYSINNGSTWTPGTTLSASYVWNDLAYDDSTTTFVAVGTAASGAPVSAYTTTGLTWQTGGTMNLSLGNFQSIAASGLGTYATAGYNTGSIEVSTNSGISWTTYSLPSTQNWTSIAYGNGIWILVSGGTTASTAAAYSLVTAQTWVASTLPSAIWTGVAFNPLSGLFVAVAKDGTTVTTSNGYRWNTTTSAVLTSATGGTPNWQNIRYGNGQFLVQNPGGSAAQSSATSVDGISWIYAPMPSVQQWADAAYNQTFNTWLMVSGIATNSTAFAIVSIVGPAAYSINFGYSWSLSPSGLLTTKYWNALTYGNNRFVTIATDGTTASSTDGITWVQSLAPQNSTILNGVVIASGGGSFSCSASPIQILPGQTMYITGTNIGAGSMENGPYYIYSTTNGATQFTLSSTYPSFTAVTTSAGTPAGLVFALGGISNYTGIVWGNSRYVAIQSGVGLLPAYTFNGVNWYQGLTYLSATSLTYGQGAFIAVNSGNTTEYSSDSGVYWYQRTLTYGNISNITFGFNTNNEGLFPTLSLTGASAGNASVIYEGIRGQGRVAVTTSVITRVTQWETGSNYLSAPSVTFTDFNAQIACTVQARLSNGTLSNPTFVNRGSGYTTTSTAIAITGNGYADTYQTGYNLICNNLQTLPAVGSNIVISGVNQVYKVTSSYAVFGTVAPFIEANIQISPAMTVGNSPATATPFFVRALYSQVRITNHDFLSVGVGNRANSNYPNTNAANGIIGNEAVELNQGHVFYASSDESGNFAVGSLFGVQQSTGTVTLSATQFGLIGLSRLSLGGLAVGSNQIVISQFSTDPAFTANSDAILPTQKSIKSYITGRLSAGGANTFTGTLIAGSVLIGNPNFIQSSIPNSAPGSTVKMGNKVYISKGVDGNMAALDFFGRNAFHRS